MCGQRFQTPVNHLSAAVDVYSDWVDACEAVAKDAAEAEKEEDNRFSNYATGTAGGADDDNDYDGKY